MNKKAIGKRLREVREREKLTQLDFAKKLGVSSPAYSAYENGVNPLPIQVLDTLHVEYGISIDWLMGYSSMLHGTDPKTASDRLRLLLLLHGHGIIDIEAHDVRENGDYGHFMFIRVDDQMVVKFIDEYSKMEKLWKEGTISEQLFSLWITQQFDELDKIEYTSAADEFGPSEEDDPF